ncbi:hypothetical protein HNR50_001660 [Spirochaeta isovalerica]|uniref:Uncharacterized protein n=1 Tax=Spirochaeta isovalerica TaxID=150 RepID=A0A841RC73_9SPIO|nr:hypothetical protein [Spirochaeta isovalerica]
MRVGKGIVYFVIAYIIRTVIFYYIDFDYNIFTEDFNFLKLAIDFGMFAFIYTSVLLIGNKITRNKD